MIIVRPISHFTFLDRNYEMFILSIEIHLFSSILMGYKIKDYSILSLNEVVTRRATFFKFAAALDAMASLKKETKNSCFD